MPDKIISVELSGEDYYDLVENPNNDSCGYTVINIETVKTCNIEIRPKGEIPDGTYYAPAHNAMLAHINYRQYHYRIDYKVTFKNGMYKIINGNFVTSVKYKPMEKEK